MMFRALALRQSDSDKELRFARQLTLCDGQFTLRYRESNFSFIIIIFFHFNLHFITMLRKRKEKITSEKIKGVLTIQNKQGN